MKRRFAAVGLRPACPGAVLERLGSLPQVESLGDSQFNLVG
ncbi:hypothetical protein ACFL2Q_09715 [Thermodesulfobacteriota bacterium]